MSLAQVNTALYNQQLNEKVQRISDQFQVFTPPALSVFSSAPSHYRMRAEFRIWHDNARSYYRMFDPETKAPFNVNDFPAGSIRIGELMPVLIDNINASSILRHRLFQIEFLTTKKGEALVSLIYHKALDADWADEAKRLQQTLAIAIIGRSRKQKVVLKTDAVTETLHVAGQAYHYQQVENSFTQPNAGVNEKMLAWASQCAQNSTGDLLELYCGNGNFTCVLAQYFGKVLATEVSKVSVNCARHNFRLNSTGNAEIVRLSSEEFTQAMQGVRQFRRLRDIDLKSYDFSTVFVDPPRAGLDRGTEALVQNFDRIIYVSCNPETLKENLSVLGETHRIEKMALFDQFPYTHHVEMGVHLIRKSP